jgi:hypothetical protein
VVRTIYFFEAQIAEIFKRSSCFTFQVFQFGFGTSHGRQMLSLTLKKLFTSIGAIINGSAGKPFKVAKN